MFEIYKDGDKIFWRMRLAHGGRILAVSADGFAKRSAAVADVKRIKALADGAAIFEAL